MERGLGPLVSFDHAQAVVNDGFSSVLGVQLMHSAQDQATVRLPYREALGVARIHGGAISALIDVAATAAFWSHPALTEGAWDATVDFTVHFLKLAVDTDLIAEAKVRRRGGSVCVGDVTVRNEDGEEVAAARMTYRLTP
ncbi:MAG: PaaI family thioesterase [Gammaproteobacteria bacterium]|nr:PaaI family thioesterase [Gammaproteobacteria bacterium]